MKLWMEMKNSRSDEKTTRKLEKEEEMGVDKPCTNTSGVEEQS